MIVTTASPGAYRNGQLAAHEQHAPPRRTSSQPPQPEHKALPPSVLTPVVPARPSPWPIGGPGKAPDEPSVLQSPPEAQHHHLSPIFEESAAPAAANDGARSDGARRTLADDLLASSFQRHFSPNPDRRLPGASPEPESKSTTFHTPRPNAGPRQAPSQPHELLEGFPEGALVNLKERLSDAIRVVESHARSTDPSPAPRTVYATVGEFHADFQRLHTGLSAAIPPPARTPDRTWSTMAVLLQEHVTAEELPCLVAEGRLRDVVRSLVHCQLVNWSSIGLSGMVGLALVRHPPLDVLSFAEPRAQELAKAVNFALGYTAQSLAVGCGEVGIAVSAEGRLDMQYNKQQPVRDLIQWTSFGSFSIGFGLVDSGLVTPDMAPETVTKARIASGAVCSLAVGLHRALLPYWLTAVDPVWLDASTPAKAAAMRKAIDNLRQPRPEAIGGYLKDLGKGLKGGIGIPSLAAFTRGWYRALAAALVLSGRVVAFRVESDRAKLITNLVTDGFLGAAWGLGTTLPAKAVEGVKRSLEDEKARRQPVGRAQVADVVPPSVLARRRALVQPAGVYHE